MIKKVMCIFVICDGVVKEDVQDADTDSCTILLIIDLDANAVGTSLESYRNIDILENLTFRLIYWYILLTYSL
jgi:hypothetical protein